MQARTSRAMLARTATESNSSRAHRSTMCTSPQEVLQSSQTSAWLAALSNFSDSLAVGETTCLVTVVLCIDRDGTAYAQIARMRLAALKAKKKPGHASNRSLLRPMLPTTPRRKPLTPISSARPTPHRPCLHQTSYRCWKALLPANGLL